jgi:hypothetical protein
MPLKCQQDQFKETTEERRNKNKYKYKRTVKEVKKSF